jgi:hypothetical protein
MIDLDDLPIRPIVSVVVAIFRFLVWLWSEFLFDTLGWRIGWCVCRVLSLGNLPKVGFANEYEASTATRIAVELIGIAVLCTVAWKLTVVFKI